MLHGPLNKTALLLTLFLVLSPMFAHSEPFDTINDFDLDGKEAVFFSAELNISNGDPYTRNFGERGMFGKLVTSEWLSEHLEEYEGDAEEVFAEAKRLMIGPFFNGGGTEFSYQKVSGGKQLDLSTGLWVRSNGGEVIRLRHTTEYKNKIRYAYILLDDMTLWKKGD